MVPYPHDQNPTEDGLPTVFYIETALACNLRCPECVIGSGNSTRRPSLMSYSDFQYIWEKISSSAQLLYPYLWGEPTLNRDLAKIIALASCSAHVQVNTNGTLLTQPIIESYLESKLGTLMFSIDGVSQPIYEKYRVGGSCELAWKNLELSSKLIYDHQSDTDLIAVLIAFKHNEHEIPLFLSRCSDLGIRSLVRPAYLRYGSVDRPENPNYHHPSYYPNEQIDAVSKCPHLTSAMTIGVDGKTLLCTQDFSDNYQFPSLLDSHTTLQNVWFSNEFKRLRDTIAQKRNIPSMCSACIHYPLKS